MAFTAFAALTQATGQQLDNNFSNAFASGGFSGTISGTDSLAFAVSAEAPTISALVSGMTFFGIAVNTNTTNVLLTVGAFSPLQVYKDTTHGPAQLTGGEIIAQNACWFTYDPALNAAAGGFHLRTGGAILTGQTVSMAQLNIGAGQGLKRLFSAQATVSFTVTLANSTQDVNIPLSGVAIGDSVSVGTPATIASGVVYSGYVAAVGTVTLRAANVTAASLTPTGGIFRVTSMGFP